MKSANVFLMHFIKVVVDHRRRNPATMPLANHLEIKGKVRIILCSQIPQALHREGSQMTDGEGPMHLPQQAANPAFKRHWRLPAKMEA